MTTDGEAEMFRNVTRNNYNRELKRKQKAEEGSSKKHDKKRKTKSKHPEKQKPSKQIAWEELSAEQQLDLIEEFKASHVHSYYDAHPAPNSAINALAKLTEYSVDQQYYR